MITVNSSSSKNPKINASVSEFISAIGYCEYQIPFYLQGVKPPPSVNIQKGTKAHKQEEIYEKEHYEFKPITTQELQDVTKEIEFQREVLHTRLQFSFSIGGTNPTISLAGRCDKIFREDNSLIILDDKFPANPSQYMQLTRPYTSQLLQLLVYLNSSFTTTNSFDPNDWFEIPHETKRWILQIRDRKNNNEPCKVFQGVQDSKTESFLFENIQRFGCLVLNMEKYKHHNSIHRCNACSFKDMCKHRVQE